MDKLISCPGECHRNILPSSGQEMYSKFAKEGTKPLNIYLYVLKHIVHFIIIFNTCQFRCFKTSPMLYYKTKRRTAMTLTNPIYILQFLSLIQKIVLFHSPLGCNHVHNCSVPVVININVLPRLFNCNMWCIINDVSYVAWGGDTYLCVCWLTNDAEAIRTVE